MTYSVSQPYVQVYKNLMHIKEYAKYFDTKAVGGMYRLIQARVWRVGVAGTKGMGYFSTDILAVARYFDAGKLAAVSSDVDMAGWLGVTERHVRRLRKQLIDLGLVKVQKVNDTRGSNFIYVVGEYYGSSEVGNLVEMFFIQDWLKQIEAYKATHDTLITEELPFVAALTQVLSSGKKKQEIYDNGVGHTGPGVWTYMSTNSPNKGATNTAEDGDNEIMGDSYKDNDIITRKNSIAEQPSLGFEVEPTFDLSSLNFGLTPDKFVSMVRVFEEEFGKDVVVNHLQTLAEKESFTIKGGFREALPYSSIFDAWMRKARFSERKVGTLLLCWWKLLGLDLDRPHHFSGVQKSRIILSKAKVNHWGEFSYLLHTNMLHSQRGFDKVRGLSQISWLVKWINDIAWKLKEYRATYEPVDDIDILRAHAKMDREDAERKERMKEQLSKFSGTEDATDVEDISDEEFSKLLENL